MGSGHARLGRYTGSEILNHTVTEMIDAVFDVSGDTLPSNYPFAVWESLVRHAPTLENHLTVGVIPLRTTNSEAGMLIPKRAKLTIRVPAELSELASTLSGLSIAVESGSLQLGSLKLRPILPYPTLHAHLVHTDDDEVEFINGVTARLHELGIDGKLICGMRNHLVSPERKISGFSLVIHDLKPDASLRLQYTGLGADRRYGCGIFIPYKVISDLD